jgi:uncharacterized protein with von Willebrand factor type A (vWA) domain
MPGRGCRLIAFGGPDEVIERDLAPTPEGLAALLALMGQAFDGGTDVQTPIERAIARVHEARWRSADLLIVSDGEFGCVPATLARLDEAKELGLRVQGVLVGDRETWACSTPATTSTGCATGGATPMPWRTAARSRRCTARA